MFKIIERFFRAFVDLEPLAWEDENDNATDFGAEPIKQNIYPYFGKGWEKLLRCDDGWINIIAECHSELLNIDKNYKIYQIKEKFGTLRYYCEPSHSKHKEQFGAIVDKYERMSIKTCEISGASGVLMKKDGHFKTLNPTLGKTLGYEKCKANQK
jgi:hypothetical protein